MTLEKGAGRNLLFRWLEWGSRELGFLSGREAWRECELLLEDLLGLSTRAELYLTEEINPSLFLQFYRRIQIRKGRRPLAYILGKAYFWAYELRVEEGVFIPRPETESLIESFLNSGECSQGGEFRFLDLGTGSGNIAITLARLFPRSKGVASDLSSKSLGVAKENAKRFGVSERLEFIQADGLQAFGESAFDTIFSNPPYVSLHELECLEPELHQEPRLALEGGGEGLDFYRKILEGLSALKEGGSLWVEIDCTRAENISSLLGGVFRMTKVFKDLEGKDRVVSARGFYG